MVSIERQTSLGGPGLTSLSIERQTSLLVLTQSVVSIKRKTSLGGPRLSTRLNKMAD